jgi:hypothetical protein
MWVGINLSYLPTYPNIDLNFFWSKLNLTFQKIAQIMPHGQIPL